jgi:hypothetical protein
MNCFLCVGFVSPGSGVAQVGVFLFRAGRCGDMADMAGVWYVYYMLIYYSCESVKWKCRKSSSCF